MKKAVAILLTLLCFCATFTGCGTSFKGEQDRPLTVYSFCGENAYFSISNGVIVLSSEEEIFYGGNLEANQEEFDDITAYSITFYVMSNNEKYILLSNRVVDMTGGTIHLSGDAGKISGGGTVIRAPTDELQNNLFCELETTTLDDEKNNYQLQLSLTEITATTDG